MKAYEVLNGLANRVVKIDYAGKTWSGIRVAGRREGEPHTLELSRFSGCVGDIKAETLLLGINEVVRVEGEEPKAEKKAKKEAAK